MFENAVRKLVIRLDNLAAKSVQCSYSILLLKRTEVHFPATTSGSSQLPIGTPTPGD